jgi:uncharacterized protein
MYILDGGGDVDVTDDDGTCALLLAAGKGRLEVCAALLRRQANVNVKRKSGATPLHVAARGGHIDICQALLDHGADVDAKSADGRTALHLAALWGKPAVCMLLLERHADFDLTRNDLEKIKDLARIGCNREVIGIVCSWAARQAACDAIAAS